MPDDAPLRKGARPFLVILDADLDAVVECGGWQAWREQIVQGMESEGIVVTRVEGTRFEGHFFPDRIAPRLWLRDHLDSS